MPSCGADLLTTRGASNCESLTQCSDPSVQCSCNLDPEEKEPQAMAFAESRAGLVCHTTTCPEGTTPRGLLCACDDGAEEEPRPRLLPVEDVFVTDGESELVAPPPGRPGWASWSATLS